jgi:acid phosphatase type 7
MRRLFSFLLAASAVALSTACAAQASSAGPDYRPAAGKDPQTMASEYLARRTGKAAVLIGAGDIALCLDAGQAKFAEATARLLESVPDALVFTAGDNVYLDGLWSEYIGCYDKSWGRKRIKERTLPAPGNHDYGNTRSPHEASAYFRYFGASAANAGTEGKGYYSVDLGAWHIVSLNSDIAMRDERDGESPLAERLLLEGEVARQQAWLRADLDGARRRGANCILGIWHHPRFTNAPRGDNAPVGKLWDALLAAGADVVVNGHEHIYENFAPRGGGMREFVVGTGGAGGGSAATAANYHYGVLKLTLEAGGYSWEFLPVAGDRLIDKGTGSCNKKPRI